jgi:hypothetical protein
MLSPSRITVTYLTIFFCVRKLLQSFERMGDPVYSSINNPRQFNATIVQLLSYSIVYDRMLRE